MPFLDKELRLEYQRNWIRKRRNEYFQGKVCIRCGSLDDLQLDHINPALKISHRIWSWSRDRQKLELDKCQVLCRKCHDNKTWKEDYFPDHGTTARYETHKCKCVVCKKWKSDKNRRYRESLIANVAQVGSALLS